MSITATEPIDKDMEEVILEAAADILDKGIKNYERKKSVNPSIMQCASRLTRRFTKIADMIVGEFAYRLPVRPRRVPAGFKLQFTLEEESPVGVGEWINHNYTNVTIRVDDSCRTKDRMVVEVEHCAGVIEREQPAGFVRHSLSVTAFGPGARAPVRSGWAGPHVQRK